MKPRAIFPFFVLVLVGCGNKPDAQTPPSTTPPETKSSSATAPPTAEPTAEPPKPHKKPLEAYNSCVDVVTIVIGPDPKAADAGKRTIAPSSSIDLPRDPEGNQTIWLLDSKGEPLPVKVRVTLGMKRVEVGRSCKTLDAR